MQRKPFTFLLFSLTLITTLLPVASLATPIFTITPMARSFSVTQGTTSEVQYDVRNTSGAPLTITNESVSQSSSITSDSISSDSTCENTSLASNSDCTLDVDITGNRVGSDTVQPEVCAFNGQLCSKVASATTTTVVAQNTFNCATNSNTKQCRVFATEGTYKGDLSEGSGAVDTSNCQSNASGTTKGNCICEDEAAAAGYGHPGHWRVWLSTNALSAISNIRYTAGGSLKYVRASNTNTTVANAGDLVGNNLQNSIGTSNTCVYTSTRSTTGAKFSAVQSDCAEWTSTANQATVAVRGRANDTINWSNDPNDLVCDSSPFCSLNQPLYCFELPG